MNTFEIGRLIRRCREEKDLTQSALADMLKISNRTVSKWENGDGFPDITIVPQLCEILGITSDELLAGRKNASDAADENEVLYEATSPSTKKYYEQLFRVHTEHISLRWATVLSCIDLLALIVILLLFTFKSGTVSAQNTVILCGFCVFVVLIVMLRVFLPKIQAGLQLRKIRDLNNGTVCDETVCVTGKNQLDIRCGSSKSLVNASDVTAFYEKKDLYILRFSKFHYAYVVKDGFTIGNPNDFAAYIRSNMTQKRERRTMRILSGILAVILTLTTFGTLLPASLYVAVRSEQSSYENYTEMNASQLAELGDEELYDAVSARVDAKYYGNHQTLNEYERTFFEINDLLAEYECGGFCGYLYNHVDGNIEPLYKALETINDAELLKKLQDFMDENEINPNEFNSKNDYEKLSEKYPFDKLDKSIESDCKLLKILLIEFVRANVNYF